MIIDTGDRHESKIKSKNLDCPPLSGYNHLAVYIRWAYNKGLLSEELLKKEPRIEAAMRGEGDLREVIATSRYMNGKIRSEYFNEEGELFTKQFYQLSGDKEYASCVDKNAENYFGSRYRAPEFNNEAYLFVPYDEEYYKNLSKFIDDAWDNRAYYEKKHLEAKEDLIKWLLSVAKNEIRANLTYEGDTFEPGEATVTELTASRIGGKPAVPAGFEWPYFEGVGFDDPEPKNRPLSFLAQINLKEVAPLDKEELLPKTGILSFFYELDTMTWGFDPKDKGSARVYYFEEGTELHLEDIPADMEKDYRVPEFSVTFEEHISLPDMSEFDDELSLDYDDNTDCLFKAGYEVDEWANNTKLLGYSDTIQNPMYVECETVTRGWRRGNKEDIEKIPSAEKIEINEMSKQWMLLFQMGTVESDDYELMFGDCGHIYFWIKKSDLAAKNFDNVWLILQCS